jgi:glycerate-2-kinase
MFYPAKIVGLIFCDVPGNHSDLVASGPTFKDSSTAKEAEEILDKYNIRDHYVLTETPKEDIFFKNVTNLTLVSNELALSAMKTKAEELGYSTKIISSEIYDDMDAAISKLQSETDTQVVLAGGEPSLIIKTPGGSGGRNQYLSLKALKTIKENELVVSLASDGIDNGPMAGAIADVLTKGMSISAGLDIDDHVNRYDAQTFFEKIGANIFTGQTGSNVSDLMLILRKKNG